MVVQIEVTSLFCKRVGTILKTRHFKSTKYEYFIPSLFYRVFDNLRHPYAERQLYLLKLKLNFCTHLLYGVLDNMRNPVTCSKA